MRTTRRGWLRQAGGLALAGLVPLRAPRPARAAAAGTGAVVEIVMRSDPLGTKVGFDPIGILIEPGQTVRWVNDGNNVHTTTAYHPANGDRSLRIPEGAEPWDSGYLVNPGDAFEVTPAVEGVYDYLCTPHEIAGMVGRIVVGRPGTGPGTLPFDYFLNDPAVRDWQPVPPAAQAVFPPIETIMRQRTVRLAG